MNLSSKNEGKKKSQKVHGRVKTEKQLSNNSCVLCLSSILPHPLLLPSFPLLSACYAIPTCTFVTYIHHKLRAEYEIEHAGFFFPSETG